MRTFDIIFLAVLSCIAMIGATSIGDRSPVMPRDLNEYVACNNSCTHDLIEILSPAASKIATSPPTVPTIPLKE